MALSIFLTCSTNMLPSSRAHIELTLNHKNANFLNDLFINPTPSTFISFEIKKPKNKLIC